MISIEQRLGFEKTGDQNESNNQKKEKEGPPLSNFLKL
jgi:hypothetical protein